MSKESVSLPTTIDRAGVNTIRHLVGSVCGIYLTEELMGGYYRVSNDGKIAKRIRRNLKRELGVDLPDELISMIGNAANSHSFKQENYLAEYIDDLLSIVGKFGDGDSCFRVGRQNHHHLLALMDAGTVAFCVYHSTGENLGRAWCHKADNGAEVFFNAYGFDLYKIGQIASILNNDAPLKVGRIEATHDIWINQGGDACIINGGKKTTYTLEIQEPDTFAPHHCHHCRRAIWNLDDARTSPTGQLWCYGCYRNRFWTCQRCGIDMDSTVEEIQRVHGSRQYDTVCLSCARVANYYQCDHCTRSNHPNDHWYLNRNGLKDYRTENDEILHLCERHYDMHARCRFCNDQLAPKTVIDVILRGDEYARTCPHCAGNSNDITYCPDCHVFSWTRQSGYSVNFTHPGISWPQCRRCGMSENQVHAIVINESEQLNESQSSTSASFYSGIVDTGTGLRLHMDIPTTIARRRIFLDENNELDVELYEDN